MTPTQQYILNNTHATPLSSGTAPQSYQQPSVITGLAARVETLESHVIYLTRWLDIARIAIAVLAFGLVAIACSPIVMEVLLGPRPPLKNTPALTAQTIIQTY